MKLIKKIDDFRVRDDVFFDEKIRYIAGNKDSILDIGGGTRFQKQLKPYKSLLSDRKYVCLDKDPACQPDIVADAHHLPIADGAFDAVLCHSVLEHVENPFQVVREIYRVLKSDGVCLACVPFLSPYHGGGPYLDYWRFSQDGVAVIFKDFTVVEVCPTRHFLETWFHLLVPPVSDILSPLGKLADQLLRTAKYRPHQVAGWLIFAAK